WARTGSDAVARANLLVGTQLPVGKDAQTDIVNLVSSGKAAVADAAYMPRTSGRFVQVTGADADSPRQESLWWVAENGVRYGIDVKAAEHAGTDPVLQALGLGAPVPAPWSIISLFPAGHVLSQRDARLQHDGIAPAELVAPLPGSHVGG
ncbi:MAG: type VII secretion protein EccB, partial [Mycobacteriaceae bacterium]|nr:type VII secretion protein EccB [Mycobacteriaceae bacterium]